MKLHQDDNFVLTNSKNEKKFTINASAKAFKILSSSLYSRKVEAIVRELSCNAYDSHVFAGKVDVPFSVTLPTMWEPEFSIEDFGVGLNKQEVEEIYTSYFTSTKTESNDVIGALGLGSKTPFSYTDTFTIRTRKDGKEYCYNAFINAAGEPSVALVAESDTEEPNGVKVTVPVRDDDRYEFKECCEKVYAAFRVQPIITNTDVKLNIKPVNFEHIDEHGFSIVNSYAKNTIYALMGNVVYEVTNVTKTFSKYFDTEHSLKRVLENVCLMVKFDIGELDVAASRETISFDEITEKNFIDKLLGISGYIMNDAQEKLEAFDNVVDAYKFASNIGEWAFDMLSYRSLKLSQFRLATVGRVICNYIEDYFRPITLMPVLRDMAGKVRLNNGVPMYATYDVTDKHVYNYSMNFYSSRNTICESLAVNGGVTLPNLHSTGAKIYIYEGWVDGITSAIKEDLNAMRKASLTMMYNKRPFSMITKVKLPAEAKEGIVEFFGEQVVFVDSDEFIKDFNEKKRQIRLARAAERKAALEAQGLPQRDRAKRRKEDEINIIESRVWQQNSNQVLVEEHDKKRITVSELKDAIVLYRRRNTYYNLHRRDIHFNPEELASLMLATNCRTIYVVHSSDQKSIDRATEHTTDPMKTVAGIEASVNADLEQMWKYPNLFERLCRYHSPGVTIRLNFMKDVFEKAKPRMQADDIAFVEQALEFDRWQSDESLTMRYSGDLAWQIRSRSFSEKLLTQFIVQVNDKLDAVRANLETALVVDDLSRYLLQQRQMDLLFNYLETLDKLKPVV